MKIRVGRYYLVRYKDFTGMVHVKQDNLRTSEGYPCYACEIAKEMSIFPNRNIHPFIKEDFIGVGSRGKFMIERRNFLDAEVGKLDQKLAAYMRNLKYKRTSDKQLKLKISKGGV